MKKIIACFLALYLHIYSYGQVQSAEDSKSLLWQISGNQLDRPSYLFGAMHMLCSENYVWTPIMRESLKNSAKVCFEMNLGDPAVVMQAASGFMDNSGKKLESWFTPEQYNILQSYFKEKLHLDLALFQQIKPMGIQSMLMMLDMQCTDPVSYEDSLMKTAQKDHKQIMGLEEAKEQLDVLDSIPVDSVISDLMDAIQNKNKNDKEYNELTEAYKKQDLPRLYTLIENSKGMGEDMGIFLDERNKKWIARMGQKMKGTSVFFAVGAGHLWGDNGVISLLRKAGYTVVPMK